MPHSATEREYLKTISALRMSQTLTLKKTKSTIAIIFLTIFSIQLSMGILALPFSKSEPLTLRVTLPIIYMIILTLIIHFLLWQIRGRYVITPNKTHIEILLTGGLINRKVILDKKNIRISIKDLQVSTGPLVILQLLGITSPYNLKIVCDKKTLTIGCNSIEDAKNAQSILTS